MIRPEPVRDLRAVHRFTRITTSAQIARLAKCRRAGCRYLMHWSNDIIDTYPGEFLSCVTTGPRLEFSQQCQRRKNRPDYSECRYGPLSLLATPQLQSANGLAGHTRDKQAGDSPPIGAIPTPSPDQQSPVTSPTQITLSRPAQHRSTVAQPARLRNAAPPAPCYLPVLPPLSPHSQLSHHAMTTHSRNNPLRNRLPSPRNPLRHPPAT